MRSTFMGLEASKRGLYTQQSALYTTGHNISNANTIGYSRQRVNMETTPGFPGTGLNTGKTAGHIGTGVQASSVQRIRDEFVDRQYRQETNKLGYWQSTTKSISQMEDIMAEPSEFGINKAFTEFWKSMEDVIDDPKDTAARKVMISKGQSLTDSFNYMDTQLKQIQGNIGNEINVVTDQVNSLLKQIADINKQIQTVEPNGYMPNDLYDTRDVLVDQLNDIIPVSISLEKSGGNALAIAEGSMTITYKDASGKSIDLVRGKEFGSLSSVGPELDATGNPVLDGAGNPVYKEIDGDVDNSQTAGYSPFSHIVMTSVPIKTLNPAYNPNAKDPNHGDYDPNYSVPEFVYPRNEENVSHNALEPSKGRLAALIDAYGYEDAAKNVQGTYPEMMKKIDGLAKEIIDQFNSVHSNGVDLAGLQGVNFFGGTTARDMKVAITDPKQVAAAGGLEPIIDQTTNTQAVDPVTGLLMFKIEEGNNKNILGLSALQSAVLGNLQGGTFQSYYKSLIGELGVKGKQAITNEYNSTTLHLQIENNRASHNSVSLDEEMTNMITFQQAYNANARMITVIDETLDKIINGMGRVGL
ncbi:flagellar hook-associated protein FlgK [Solibacillus merdavium]|uniref:Flagellar hook-associated protein 1 n=1 Tax=Solibacillus merdavium TaxID=2762218 RepID=A0ABR8XHP8_9BACL|nr:flagellar hook-associated protein FlgK [Solibacillus merdavium]MBD8031463.1 flagellar hook-associated protein FlgK [Solibacillus merdavium]